MRLIKSERQVLKTWKVSVKVAYSHASATGL